MINVSREKINRLLSIHGWSGITLGLFLYVVIVTGAVAVLASEIGEWSAGGKNSEAPLTSGINKHVLAFAETVNSEYTEDVSIFGNSASNAVVFFHTHATNSSGLPDDLGTMIEFKPDNGEVILRRDGYGSELFGTDPGSALDHFIAELHINLHLPNPYGLYATGILGLVMFVAAGSGLVIHRSLLKDVFSPARYKNAVLHRRDRHVLAGSWALPFAFALAFTGSFYSFAISIGLPMVAKTAFGGDQMAMFSTLVGAPAASDETPAKTVNLDTLINDVISREGVNPTNLSISHFGRADAVVTIGLPAPEGQFIGKTIQYNGATGEYTRDKPFIGTQDSAGNTLIMLMGALHFGTFAGLLSKIVWVCMGFAMAFVTYTGMQFWVERRKDQPLWQKFNKALQVFAFGLPIALACSGIGFMLSAQATTTQFWTPVGFILGTIAMFVTPLIWRDVTLLKKRLMFLMGISLVILPPLRWLFVGNVADSFLTIDTNVLMLDCILLILGAYCLVKPRLKDINVVNTDKAKIKEAMS